MQKLTGVIDLAAPTKSRRINQNSKEWFDGEVVEKIGVLNELFNPNLGGG